MTKIGRNDPCPCGSGKKYKKCCMARERERRRAAAESPSEAATRRAIAWLYDSHEEQVRDGFEEFLSCVGPVDLAAIEDLPEEMMGVVLINFHEWFLADGVLWLEDGEVPVRDLLLGPSGPRFPVREREWMEAFLGTPLGLYEVVEARPGEGLRLRDLIHPEEEPMWVEERTASETLVPGNALGARPVPLAGVWRFSGALYGLDPDRIEVPDLVRELREDIELEAEGDPEVERQILAYAIPSEWLTLLLERAGLLGAETMGVPELVDSVQGDPILFVSDLYRVRDWQRLEDALAAREDVEGDRERGWVRFEDLGEGGRRLLVSLGTDPEEAPDADLEVTAITRSRADVGRGWLEAVAGDALEFIAREATDPREELGKRGALPAGPPDEGGPVSGMSTEMMEQVYRAQYRNWADDRIPALGDKTPRQAMRTKAGREQVIGLLELYEDNERRMARQDDREPASLEFLWREIGLDRERVPRDTR